jgi:hypothetical protein
MKENYQMDEDLMENRKFRSRPHTQSAYIPPRNDLERTVAAIWQKILGIDQIGIHDDFFELGGDSIILIQVVTELSKVDIWLNPEQMLQSQANKGASDDLSVKAQSGGFEVPTIAEITLLAQESQKEREQRNDVEKLLSRIGELSSGEVDLLLHNFLIENEVDE